MQSDDTSSAVEAISIGKCKLSDTKLTSPSPIVLLDQIFVGLIANFSWYGITFEDEQIICMRKVYYSDFPLDFFLCT